MNQSLTNLLLTVLSGVLVFTIGQLFLEFVLRPIQDYKRLKAKVAKLLVLHAQYYSNPWTPNNSGDCTPWKKASEDMREVAAEVAAFAETKPWQPLVFYSIPSGDKLNEASGYLIGISNEFIVSSDFRIREAAIEYPKLIKKNMRIKDKRR